MPHAIRIHETGTPEVMQWEEVEVGRPGLGQARIRSTAVGLNYVDTYYRSGLYPVPLPSGLGSEGAGVVEEVGPGVTDLKAGDRVAYGNAPLGSYAEVRVMPADRLIVLPPGISDQQAAAMMLKGMTAQYLLLQIGKLKQGDAILFHAAAGGVGLIACQWAKALGATVIGTVGTAEKVKLARAHGCDHVIDYTREDFVARVDEITKGEKVAVVYDGVGKDTFLKSFDCVRPRGIVVSYGTASGPVAPFDTRLLTQKGSLFLTRPTLNTYVEKRSDLLQVAQDLFDIVRSGKVKIEINQTYPLRDAVRAHQDLESRRTTGSTVFTV